MTVVTLFIVQVWAGAGSRVSGSSDDLPLSDAIAYSHIPTVQMGIAAGIAMTVVDRDGLAITLPMVPRVLPP